MVNFRRLVFPALLLGAGMAGVIAIHAWIGGRAPGELGPDPARAYYNLLVQGFRNGQLSLAREAPAGLAHLADPYDPAANADYRGFIFGEERLHDLSFYRGKLYLYFGVTPALVLFWPFLAVTGHSLSHQHAVVIFTSLGFLAGAGVIVGMWRRYFPTAPAWLALAGVLAMGLTTSAPLVLQRPEVWEVAVSGGHAMMMLTLLAVWRTLHAARPARWLALASLAFGLAVGARPSLLAGAFVLLVPLLPVTNSGVGPQRKNQWMRLLVAAVGPAAAIGVGLLVYNQLRFGSPFEFGQHYQLASDRQDGRHFGWDYLGTNLRLYFLGTASWSMVFPYFKAIPMPPLPATHGGVEFPYGLLTNTPFLLLALLAPLAWRSQPEEKRARLRRFVVTVAVVFVVATLTMGFFYGACVRYQLEFSPTLALLAVGGLFGLNAALQKQPRWRRVAMGLGLVALAYSIAFTSLYGLIRRAGLDGGYARSLLAENKNQAAKEVLEKAVRMQPAQGDLRFMLGVALARTGRLDAGHEQMIQAIRLDPANSAGYIDIYVHEVAKDPREPDAHFALGRIFAAVGRTAEARAHYEAVLRLRPGFEPAVEAIRELGR